MLLRRRISSIAGKVLFTLSDLGLDAADVKVWVDCNDPAQAALDVNDNFTAYNDKSGNGRNFTCLPAGPTSAIYTDIGQLGDLCYINHSNNAVFDWQVTDDALAINNLPQPNVVYMLMKANPINSGVAQYLFDSYHQSARNYAFHNGATNFFMPGATFIRDIPSMEQWHLYKIKFNGASSHIKIDNVASGDPNTLAFNSGLAAMRGISLFNRSTNGSAPIAGLTAQFIVCGDLSAAKEDAMDSFFDTHYSSFYGT